MAGLATYNGWPGNVREARGKQHMALVKKGKAPSTGKCELTGQTKGLTFHAEEYGSTLDDMIVETHELAPYCHGIIHMRFKMPNRFRRFKHRLLTEEFDQIYAFNSLWEFFGNVRGLHDIAEYPDYNSGVPWLDVLPMQAYKGEPKVALKWENGILVPDHEVYGGEVLFIKGVRFDSTTGKLFSYSHE
jgi:hypothetical protein